jgi:hypothetical protein
MPEAISTYMGPNQDELWVNLGALVVKSDELAHYDSELDLRHE